MDRIDCPNCVEGIKMCHRRPCWGTVEDFQRIIEQGHANKLMLDFYGTPGEEVHILSGANNNRQGSHAPFNPIGTCIFLDDNKCSIHDIKPYGGAVSCCKQSDKEVRDIVKHCIDSWRTPEGEALVKEWKRIVNYVEVDIFKEVNILSGIEMLLDALNVEERKP